QEERKVAWIFKPGFALLIGSPGINIKLIQYVDLEIALIQQHCRGSATGTAPDGSLYSDNDPSHHFGGPANTNPRDIPTLSMLGLGLLALLLGSGVSMFRNIGRPR
ncbi:MAG: hypothetical protein WAW42_18055, partial [Candidatus Competibacteraceae bacterium]